MEEILGKYYRVTVNVKVNREELLHVICRFNYVALKSSIYTPMGKYCY